MKTVEYDSMGLKWPIEVPASVEEYVKQFGADVLLRTSVNHTVYHDTLGNIRSDLAEALAAAVAIMPNPETGQPFGLISRGSGKFEGEGEDRTEIDLNDGQYINKILATTKKKIEDFSFLVPIVLKGGQVETLDKEGKSIAIKFDGNPFDPTTKPRQPGKPKTIPRQCLTAADAVLKNGAKATGIANKLAALNPDCKEGVVLDANGVVTRESLGRLIQYNEARKRAAEKLESKYEDEAALA